MKKSGFLIWFFIAVFCVLSGGCSDKDGQWQGVEFAVEENYSSGPLEVFVRVEKREITIAETLEVEISAAVEEGFEVVMPDLSGGFEGLEVYDWRGSDERLDEKGRVVTTVKYRFEPMADGETQIGEMVFEYAPRGEGESQLPGGEVRTGPIEVSVVSMLGESAATEVIDDIAEVVELKDWRWLWWTGGGLMAAVILVAIILYRRSKRVIEEVRLFKAAHELAYARLGELEKKGYVEAGMLKEFYEGLSNVLRYYIEDRFTLKAPERTTEEFLYELQYSYVLGSEDKDSVGQFLRHCDLVKFAKQEPTEIEVDGSVKLVKGFVERTKSVESQVDVTDSQREVLKK